MELVVEKFVSFLLLLTVLTCFCHPVIGLQQSNNVKISKAKSDSKLISTLMQSTFSPLLSSSGIQLSRIASRVKRGTARTRFEFNKFNDVDRVCGLGNPSPFDDSSWMKIVGGVETAPNEFPWQVFLVLERANHQFFSCGASLISDRWILTAAHCLDNVLVVHVTLGAHNVDDDDEIHQENYKSRDYFIHPDWDPHTLHGDIGLVRLPVSITFSDYVRPICLDSPSQSDANDYVGEDVVLTGWGLASDESESTSSVLRKTTATVITNKECYEEYASVITDEMICTSTSNHQGTCNGDSGGPMNFKVTDGTWKQIGIVSFGSDQGCEKGYPNGFTRVSSFANWIQNTTAQQMNNGSGLTIKQPAVTTMLWLALLSALDLSSIF